MKVTIEKHIIPGPPVEEERVVLDMTREEARDLRSFLYLARTPRPDLGRAAAHIINVLDAAGIQPSF